MTPRRTAGDQGSAVVAVAAVAAAVSVLVLGLGGAAVSVLPAVLGLAGGTAGGCGPAGTGQQVAGESLDAGQVGSAATIVQVTARRGLPAQAAVIAVATALQESSLRNLPYGDEAGPDSAGLFQQRPSAGWGTRAQVLDPVYATGAFLDRLVTIPGWQSLPLTEAANAVQRSALPGAYARWQPAAAALVAQLWPAAAASTGPGPSPGPGPDGGTGTGAGGGTGAGVVELAAAVCPGAAALQGSAASGITGVPAGFVITGSVAGQTAVRFALAQLGKPYVWGAAGPDAYDCSGLTMAAWATAGAGLAHYTGDQVHAGTPAPLDLSTAVGGDLVFIPGSDGTPEAPGHVGMIAGWAPAGPGQPAQLYLVQAPSTGRTITLTPVSAWARQISAVRHIA